VYKGETFKGALEAAFAKAGIEWPKGFRRCHDLRVTAITSDAIAGAHPIALTAKSGHANMSSAKPYLKLAGVVFRSEAEAQARRLLGQPSTESSTPLSAPQPTSDEVAALNGGATAVPTRLSRTSSSRENGSVSSRAVLSTGTFYLGSLFDVTTFEGQLAVLVLAGLVTAAVVGVVKFLRSSATPLAREVTARELIPSGPSVRLKRVSSVRRLPDERVDDFATGLGQAVMAVRDAIEHFDRVGVLLEPFDPYDLNEDSAAIYREARRVVEEAEARLPRVRLLLGDRSEAGRAAVEKLREAITKLRDYIEQPGEGEDWSTENFEAAKAALDEAREFEANFVDEVRAD
jgi:hypothetical protein